MSSVWKLKRAKETLGVLKYKRVDQPWTICDFEAKPAFEQYRCLFAEELRLLNLEEMVLWEQTYREIASLGFALVLAEEEGKSITDFLLHIDGSEAWFRR